MESRNADSTRKSVFKSQYQCNQQAFQSKALLHKEAKKPIGTLGLRRAIMDLAFLVKSDPKQIKHLQNQGFDLETLISLCEDLFSLADELGLSYLEVGEFAMRLKAAKDKAEGQCVEPFQGLYVNSKKVATRLSIEDRAGKAIFFRLLPHRGRGDESFYKCEACAGDVTVLKAEARAHAHKSHST